MNGTVLVVHGGDPDLPDRLLTLESTVDPDPCCRAVVALRALVAWARDRHVESTSHCLPRALRVAISMSEPHRAHPLRLLLGTGSYILRRTS
jgi:hypothetical protein